MIVANGELYGKARNLGMGRRLDRQTIIRSQGEGIEAIAFVENFLKWVEVKITSAALKW